MWQTLDVTLTAYIHAFIDNKFIVTSYDDNGKLLCIITMHTCMYTVCMHVAIIAMYTMHHGIHTIAIYLHA